MSARFCNRQNIFSFLTVWDENPHAQIKSRDAVQSTFYFRFRMLGGVGKRQLAFSDSAESSAPEIDTCGRKWRQRLPGFGHAEWEFVNRKRNERKTSSVATLNDSSTGDNARKTSNSKISLYSVLLFLSRLRVYSFFSCAVNDWWVCFFSKKSAFLVITRFFINLTSYFLQSHQVFLPKSAITDSTLRTWVSAVVFCSQFIPGFIYESWPPFSMRLLTHCTTLQQSFKTKSLSPRTVSQFILFRP